MRQVCFKNLDQKNCHSLEVYEKNGGYKVWRKILNVLLEKSRPGNEASTILVYVSNKSHVQIEVATYARKKLLGLARLFCEKKNFFANFKPQFNATSLNTYSACMVRTYTYLRTYTYTMPPKKKLKRRITLKQLKYINL